ncbi:hypothetical protein T484DRAFT_1850594 [Baffinella frigidus]|nr:hypothetical protein T484DRAFT_1850594 [Cryptophyta sp. CCMP2293]
MEYPTQGPGGEPPVDFPEGMEPAGLLPEGFYAPPPAAGEQALATAAPKFRN